MSGPTQDSGPAEEAPIFDSSAHPVPLRPSNERGSSTDALTGSGISVPSGPQVTEVPPATRENRRAPHDVVEVVPDLRARDTFDAEIPDESPHGRNESDNSSPGAAGGQTRTCPSGCWCGSSNENVASRSKNISTTIRVQYLGEVWLAFQYISRRRPCCFTCSHWISRFPLVWKLVKSYVEQYRHSKLVYKSCISVSACCKKCSITTSRSCHFHASECSLRVDGGSHSFRGINLRHAKCDFWALLLHLVNVDCCLEKRKLSTTDAPPYSCSCSDNHNCSCAVYINDTAS